MEREGSLPHSQALGICPYPEPDQSSPQVPSHCLCYTKGSVRIHKHSASVHILNQINPVLKSLPTVCVTPKDQSAYAALWNFVAFEPYSTHLLYDYYILYRLSNIIFKFLGAVAELQKETICFVMFVYPSVRPHGTTRLLPDILSWDFTFRHFSKTVQKIQVSIKSDKNNRYFT